MKADCERCREEVELSFAPAPGGIDVTCPKCGATYFVASAAPAPQVAPADGSGCPKCGAARRGEACQRCGLVFARWKGEASERAEAGEAAALWAACEADWDDPARHDAFLACCQRTAQFPFAAARYRAARASRGAAAEPAASRALERIEKLALTALQLSSPRAPGSAGGLPYKNAMAVLAVVLFLIVGGLLWAIFKQQARGPDDVEERVVPALPGTVLPN